MKLSIITVSYEDLNRFKKTFKNITENLLASDCRNNVEYLIKINRESDEYHYLNEVEIPDVINIRVLSENDHGIYDAMNQALEKASGKYVWFINSGDYIYSGAINKVTPKLKGYDYYRGKFIYNEQVKEQQVHSILKYSSICHQAIISKKDKTYFNTEYELAADFHLFFNKRFVELNMILCVYGNDRKEKAYSRQICKEKIEIFRKFESNWFLKSVNILALKLIILNRYN